jgi:hypothetical protein
MGGIRPGLRAFGHSSSREAYPAERSRQGKGPWVRMRTSGRKLAAVPVVESADLGMGSHPAHFGWFNGPRLRAIVVQRPVCSRCVVAGRVATKNP